MSFFNICLGIRKVMRNKYCVDKKLEIKRHVHSTLAHGLTHSISLYRHKIIFTKIKSFICPLI